MALNSHAEVYDLSIEFKQVGGASVIYELPPQYRAAAELNLNLAFNFAGPFYFKSVVHSFIDQSQFRLVGWHYELGARPFKFLEVYIEHFSQHLMDDNYPGHFPVFDAVGVRLKLI